MSIPKRRLEVLALVVLALASAGIVQENTWNQTSHYALVEALRDGTPVIDRYNAITGDKSYVGGHYYSSKAPGLALAALPVLVGVRGAVRVLDTSGRQDSMIWSLGVVCAGLPFLILLLLVRRAADWVEPGLGTLAAFTMGVGTLVLPFSTLFFAHELSTMLGFSAFYLLWRERRGLPNLRLVAAGGLVAGLATVVEYPLVLIGVVLAGFALCRADRLRRLVVYGAAAIAGSAPLFLYNLWAFGSIATFPYANAVIDPGKSGHDVIGANSQGLFGVTHPSLTALMELLFSPLGMLRLTPVVAAGALGAVLLFRRGERAVAVVVAAIAIAFLIYNSAYYLPFGGWSPGPRFLTPTIPFLAFPLAAAYRRLPGPTVALAIPSAALMVAATATEPLLPASLHTSEWAWHLRNGVFSTRSWLSIAIGNPHGWLGPLPFLALVAGAFALLVLSSPALSLDRRDAFVGGTTFAAWCALTLIGPKLVGRPPVELPLLALVLAVAAVVVAAQRFVGRRPAAAVSSR